MVLTETKEEMDGGAQMKTTERGKSDFKRGSINNPYHYYHKFKQHRDWQLGFNQAYFENLEKVKKDEERNKIRGGGQSISRTNETKTNKAS